MASALAQQDSNNRYSPEKRNMCFLRTLQLADIPDENWLSFTTYLDFI